MPINKNVMEHSNTLGITKLMSFEVEVNKVEENKEERNN